MCQELFQALKIWQQKKDKNVGKRDKKQYNKLYITSHGNKYKGEKLRLQSHRKRLN